MGQPQQLLALGPWKSIDTTSAGPYVAPNVGILGTGANPHRVPQALVAERGRVPLATIKQAASIGAIAPYVSSHSNEQVYGVFVDENAADERFLLNGTTQTSLDFNGVTDTTFFDQAVQVGSILYDNAGRQYSVLNPGSTYTWQYPPFTVNSATNIGGYTVAPSSTPIGSPAGFYGATVNFTFTRLVFGPNGAFAQESSVPQTPQGASLPQYPAYISITFPSSGTIFFPKITAASGSFGGTNADGTLYVTNVYVWSSTLPVWYFAYTLFAATTNPYVFTFIPFGMATVPSLTAFNAQAQLILARDAPPCVAAPGGPLAYHKGRVWNLVTSSAFTYPTQTTQPPTGINQEQMVLWWSKYGIPWEFDAVNQTALIDTDVPSDAQSTPQTYGEQPVALLSLSSVLLIWTTQQCLIVYGDGTVNSPFVIRKIFNIGTRARHAVAACVMDQVGTVGLWLSENGVMMTDGQYAYRVDEPIRATIESLSLSDRQNAVGFFAHHAYYLSFPQLNETWGFYLPTGDWFGPLPYATNAAYAVPADPATLGGPPGLVNVVRAARATGVQAAIDSWFTGGDLDLLEPQTVAWV